MFQAAWVYFHEFGTQPVLCLLHKVAVTTILRTGEVHETPLLQPCTSMWALKQGLLLLVSELEPHCHAIAVRAAVLPKCQCCCCPAPNNTLAMSNPVTSHAQQVHHTCWSNHPICRGSFVCIICYTQLNAVLQGPEHSSVSLLSHPLEDARPVVADCCLRDSGPATYTGWSGEQVVWSSTQLPYVATYNEVTMECVFCQ